MPGSLRLANQASSLRRLVRADPGAFMVLTKRPDMEPVASRQREGALDAFRRAGFLPVQAGRAAAGTSGKYSAWP